MDVHPVPPPAPANAAWPRAGFAYAIALFALAAAVLAFAVAARGGVLLEAGPGVALFFLAYGLFTISIGYQHPNLGYYSFDRVAQVASILVLGPVDAAVINGLASLIYPWHRLWRGVPLRHVIGASLNNAGLMTLIILVAGTVYLAIGGDVPLADLSGTKVLMLLALVLGMQVLNDVGLIGLFRLGRRSLEGFFNGFSYLIELGAGATGVLVAIVFNVMSGGVFALLLAVLTLAMLAMRQFADMRNKLERIIEDRTEALREKTRELEQQATHDNLTGLHNRRYAERYLEQQLQACRRYRYPLAIALADIDRFKQVNDLHSHAIGDAVLRRIASIMRERCRGTDMIARYGGEEFLLCFPHTDLDRAQLLCEALRSAVQADDWSRIGLTFGVTISFGIAQFRPNMTAEGLLNEADLHLYSAKKGGRNRVVA
jgi:diguanylate cyclase (GGDEF)-like protein